MTTIAVDLDGTLAHYDGWKGPTVIGDPIPRMVDAIKQWREGGVEVVIFTSRLSCSKGEDNNFAAHHIRLWLMKHGLGNLEITNIKRKEFAHFYDDRAHHVYKNTGIIQWPDPKQKKTEMKDLL